MNLLDTLTQELQCRQRVLLVGPPGCGKTARIQAAAAAAGFKVVAWRLAQCDRVDIAGALVPDTKAGVTRQLPLKPLAEILKSEGPTLWFLDDLGQAPLDVQAAVLRYFDSGELPPNVLIWGATNRTTDRAGVYGLIEPLRSRFHVAYAVPVPQAAEEQRRGVADAVVLGAWHDEIRAWCDWAAAAYPKAPEMVAWHRLVLSGQDGELPKGLQPVLYGWEPKTDPAVRMPDYRSWEAVLIRWSHGMRSLPQLAAAIGMSQAQALLAWVDGAQGCPAAETVLSSPKDAPLPEGYYTLMVERLVGALRQDSAASRLEAAMTYCTRFPLQWAYFAARRLYKDAPQVGTTRAWVAWYKEHKDVFTV